MGVTSGLIRRNLAEDPPDGTALPDPAQHVIRLRGYLRAQSRLPALGLGLAALASSGCLLAAGFSAPDPWAELVMLFVMSVAWLGTQLWMDGLDIRAGVRRAEPIISTVRKARIDLGPEGRVIVGIFAGFAVGQLLYGRAGGAAGSPFGRPDGEDLLRARRGRGGRRGALRVRTSGSVAR